MNQLSKFMAAIALSVCFSLPVSGYCFDGGNICIIELLFENKAFSTYRAICCPGGEQFTFQALPGLKTGTGCSGSHCFKEIKVQFETEIETLIETLTKNNERQEELLNKFEALLRGHKSDGDFTEFLSQFQEMNISDEQAKEISRIISEYRLKLKTQSGAIIASQKNDKDDPEKRRLVVHGFQSDLERFGYDDDPRMPMEKKEIEDCLKKAKFTSCCYAEFKHPVSEKDVIVQIILCESEAGTPTNGLKKKMHAFGFQIKQLPKGMDKADVFNLDGKDVFLPTGCDRHCLIVQLGNIIAGVTLAEHRLDDCKK